MEYGAFAFLSICTLFVLAIRKVLRCAVRGRNEGARVQYALVLGILLGLLTNALVRDSYGNVLLWTVVGLALACRDPDLNGELMPTYPVS